MVDYIRNNPGATQRQIRDALGLTSKSHIEKCLGIAKVAGLIEARHLPKRGYYSTDEPRREDLMTVRQVAVALGYSDEHVYRLAKLGRIKSLRIGNNARIPSDECERLKSERTLGEDDHDRSRTL
jgi:excisionase family DNA binding protein